MLTTCPAGRPIRSGRNACVTASTPERLTPTVARWRASGTSRNAPPNTTPALLTSTSTGPCSARSRPPTSATCSRNAPSRPYPPAARRVSYPSPIPPAAHAATHPPEDAMFRLDLGRPARYCDGLDRRSFLQLGVAGMATVGLPQLLRAKAASADTVTSKDTAVIL